MVVLLTYVSLILGELVPKRLALTRPEAIASRIARPMDILATIGRAYTRFARRNASRVREFGLDDADVYIQEVVDATQQDIHDGFVDTSWPTCPRHSHPLWLHDGGWWCEADQICFAPLGQLGAHLRTRV